MWKSREAFEKSVFFKRLKIQGFDQVTQLWPFLENGTLNSHRTLRLNSLRELVLEDLSALGLEIGDSIQKKLSSLEGFAPAAFTFDFDLSKNASFNKHPLWGAGLAYVQDVTAFEIVKDLDVRPGQWVMDTCAAPGGKSLLIADLLQSAESQKPSMGWLVSNDFDLKRARILSNNLIRYGALRSSVFAKAATSLCENFKETFDRILVDAPCSGESLFFKREDKRRDVYESEVQELAQLQYKILSSAALSLKSGGRLVYSTCSYNRSENEEIVAKFLKQNSEFSLLKEERRWPHLNHSAGGYWAVLEKSGSSQLSSLEFGAAQGAERNGFYSSDSSLNFYAASMRTGVSSLNELWSRSSAGFEDMSDWILMSDEEAVSFLKGEALANHERKRGLHRILWRGKWPLGVAKGVESRFNNLLPLEARY